MIRLGPFELVERIGRGGMGRVWKARHIRQGVYVAIKVLSEELARADANANTTFYHEARTAARLDHPSIVMLFDYGEVGEDAEAQTGGDLVAGSPYFAMELVSGGTLSDMGPKMASWRSLRHVLLQVLEALAYAHARDVVHRDIKPANILVLDEDTSMPQIKLSDFGLARVFAPDFDEVFEKTQGTPPYMAPEHIRGNWRSQGPWTDLYALGCVAYQLVTGTLPFENLSGKALLKAHLSDPVPPPAARFAVPNGFEDWLLRLLAKNTQYRFRRAADAAFALSKFPRTTEAPANFTPPPILPVRRALSGVVSRDTPDSIHEQTTEAVGPPTFESSAEAMPSAFASSSDESPATALQSTWLNPPLPEDWRRSEERGTSASIVGVGLELFDIRERPFVDRESEREALWRALQDVHASRSCRTVALAGPAGTGKSRLARWLSERAHEVGAANVLHARHSDVDGGDRALGRMIAEHLRCTGLERSRVHSVVERCVAADRDPTLDERVSAAVLAGMICSEGEVSDVTTASRRDALTLFVERLCAERPVIIVMEDVHWAEESLKWVSSILQSPKASDLPVLVVMTARHELLTENPMAVDLLRQLTAGSSGEHIDIGPLPQEAHEALVGQMLSMEPELARKVVEGTRGNPLYAIQLVGDWVDRDILSIGEHGFRLPAGSEPPLPENLIALCDERIAHLARELEQEVTDLRPILELAAALGSEFEEHEWRLACELRQLDIPDQLLRHIERRGMLRRHDSRWAFTHGVLRDSLLSRAEREDRLILAHQTCAELLEDAAIQDPYGNRAARRARHLIRAEQFEEALEPLIAAAEGRRREGSFAAAADYIESWRDALAEASPPDDDPRRANGRLVAAHSKILEGELDLAEELLEEARPIVLAVDDDSLRAEWYRIRGKLAYDRGSFAESDRLYRDAVELFEAQGDPDAQAVALQGLGAVGRSTGDYASSIAAYREAISLFDDSNEPLGLSSSLYGLADALRRIGRLEDAEAYLRDALNTFEQHGLRFGKAHALNLLGEIARQTGDLEAAEAHYTAAAGLMRRLHAGDESMVRINLALVLLERGDWQRAGATLTHVLWDIEQRGEFGFEIAVHAALIPCMAHAGLWEEFDTHLDRTAALFAETGMVDQDVARVLALGVAAAEAAGEDLRARRARELEQAQREKIEQ
ncbi:MAG: serine/threonine-protein kinase PknK [Myxococcota bacterium]